MQERGFKIETYPWFVNLALGFDRSDGSINYTSIVSNTSIGYS